jgi:hypothetical protein
MILQALAAGKYRYISIEGDKSRPGEVMVSLFTFSKTKDEESVGP